MSRTGRRQRPRHGATWTEPTEPVPPDGSERGEEWYRDDQGDPTHHHGAPAHGLVMGVARLRRSEEHTSELQSLMRSSYAVFCLKKKKKKSVLHREINSIE